MQVWSESGCTNIDLGTREVTRFGAGPALLAGAHKQTNPTTIEERNALMKTVFGKFITQESCNVEAFDSLTAELTEFVQCVREQKAPSVSGREGLAAIETADLILQNIAAHCWDGTPAGRVGAGVAAKHHNTAA